MINVIDRKYHKDSKIFNNIYIVPDIRFFTLYALFNGIYDYHYEYAEEMSAARLELTADIKRVAAGIDELSLQRWKHYFCTHKAHIWYYIYYTSFCQLPPRFELSLDADDECRRNSAEIENFNQILSEFYDKCEIERLYFEKYKPLLMDYISAYDEKTIHSDIDYVHHYLRIPKPAVSALDIVIVPIPFESHFMGYGAPQKNKLYLFESIGGPSRGLNIHEYLHAFVNPTVEALPGIHSCPAAAVFDEQKHKEWILSDYGELHSFVSENFVRAITYRIIANLYGKQNFCFDELSQYGLVLVKEIYTRLKEDYEVKPDTYNNIHHFIRTYIAPGPQQPQQA